MDVLPDATEPDHSEVQDALAAGERPRHAAVLESLDAHRFIGGLRKAGAAGKARAARGPIAYTSRLGFTRHQRELLLY